MFRLSVAQSKVKLGLATLFAISQVA